MPITTYRKVRYKLKTPYRDGTTGDLHGHVIFEPLDFIARLAVLMHKPRVNLTRLDEKHPCLSGINSNSSAGPLGELRVNI
jgi:hypothetical protein